nr:hypothetical protein CFP56_51367 [Quercus suber]
MGQFYLVTKERNSSLGMDNHVASIAERHVDRTPLGFSSSSIHHGTLLRPSSRDPTGHRRKNCQAVRQGRVPRRLPRGEGELHHVVHRTPPSVLERKLPFHSSLHP